MKHYLDITLLPDAEANLGFIWQKVYQQIHIALAENKLANGDSAIAVSFPEYNKGRFPLGDKLRLFASSQDLLQKLDIGKWLNRLSDYTKISSLEKVPDGVADSARFSRRQFDTNVERLVRRRAKRKGETLEQALKYYANFKDQQSDLPFINMQSLSKQKRFRLFIERSLVGDAVAGEFSCYGLSKTATVPWF